MNYPSAEMTLGSLNCSNLQAANLNFEATTVSTLTVLDSTTLKTSVSIQANSFASDEPLAVFDKEGNELYTLPTTEPSSGQVLTCPQSGTNLIWTNGGGGGGTVNSISNTDNNLSITGTTDITINLANNIQTTESISSAAISGQTVIGGTIQLSGGNELATAISLPTGWTGNIGGGLSIITNSDNTSNFANVVSSIDNTDNNITITGTKLNPIINLSNTILGATSIGAPTITSSLLLDVQGQLQDSNGSTGLSGYLLSSSNNGVAWIENSSGSVSTWAQYAANTDINTNGFQIQGVTGNFIDLNTDSNIQIGCTGSINITCNDGNIELNPAGYVLINNGLQSNQVTVTNNLGLVGTITDGFDEVGSKGQALFSNGGSKVQWADVPITTISNSDNNLVITPAANNYNIDIASTITNYRTISDIVQSNRTFYLTGELVDNNYQQGGTAGGMVLTSTYVAPPPGSTAGGTYGALWQSPPTSEDWSTNPAIADVNIDNYSITNIDGLTANNITSNTSLSILGTLLDATSVSGTNGQLLSSTGTGISWINAPSAADWSGYTAMSNVNIGAFNINSGGSSNIVIGNISSFTTPTLDINNGTAQSLGDVNLPNVQIHGALSDQSSSPGSTGYILTSTNDGILWQAPSASMGLLGGTNISIGTTGDNNIINLDVSNDIEMNGNNIGSTDDLSLYIYGTQNYLKLDQYGNIVLNNQANNTYISNVNGSTSGAIDMFVNWDGNSVWGSELYIDNDIAQITTNSAANIWQFNNDGSLNIPGDIVLPYDAIKNVNNIYNDTHQISIYNETDGVTNAEVDITNTNVVIKTTNGTNEWTFDNAGDLTLAGDIISPYANITNVNNIENDTNAISIYNHTSGTSNGKIIVTNTDVIINTNNGANVWTFGDDGILTLPNIGNNSIITTEESSLGAISIQTKDSTGGTIGGQIYLTPTTVELNTNSLSGRLNTPWVLDEDNTLNAPPVFLPPSPALPIRPILNMSQGNIINILNLTNVNDSISLNTSSDFIISTGSSIVTTINNEGEIILPIIADAPNAGIIYPDGQKQVIAYNPNKYNLFTAIGFSTVQSGYSFNDIDFTTGTYNGAAVFNDSTVLGFTTLDQYYLLNFNYGGVCTTAAFPPASISQTNILVSGGGAYVLGFGSGDNAIYEAHPTLNQNFSFPISCIVYSGTTSGGNIVVQQAGDVLVSGIQTTLTLIPLPYNQNGLV